MEAIKILSRIRSMVDVRFEYVFLQNVNTCTTKSKISFQIEELKKHFWLRQIKGHILYTIMSNRVYGNEGFQYKK